MRAIKNTGHFRQIAYPSVHLLLFLVLFYEFDRFWNIAAIEIPDKSQVLFLICTCQKQNIICWATLLEGSWLMFPSFSRNNQPHCGTHQLSSLDQILPVLFTSNRLSKRKISPGVPQHASQRVKASLSDISGKKPFLVIAKPVSKGLGFRDKLGN